MKMKRFVREYVKGTPKADAVILAGYNVKDRANAHVLSTELLKKPIIEAEIEKVLDRAGLDKQALAYKLNTAIDAGLDRPQTATVSDSLRGIEIGFKLLGHLNSAPANDSRSVTVNYNNLSLGELKREMDKLREEEVKFLQTEERDENKP